MCERYLAHCPECLTRATAIWASVKDGVRRDYIWCRACGIQTDLDRVPYLRPLPPQEPPAYTQLEIDQMMEAI